MSARVFAAASLASRIARSAVSGGRGEHLPRLIARRRFQLGRLHVDPVGLCLGARDGHPCRRRLASASTVGLRRLTDPVGLLARPLDDLGASASAAAVRLRAARSPSAIRSWTRLSVSARSCSAASSAAPMISATRSVASGRARSSHDGRARGSGPAIKAPPGILIARGRPGDTTTREIESRWQELWARERTWEVGETSPTGPSEKSYVLEMLPYPSGEPHIGHLKNYALGDAIAHFHRRTGAGPAPDGLRRVRSAGREPRHPYRRASAQVDRELDRRLPARVPLVGDLDRLVTRARNPRARVLPLDPVDLPSTLRTRSRLPQGGRGQVVPERRDRCWRTSR